MHSFSSIFFLLTLFFNECECGWYIPSSLYKQMACIGRSGLKTMKKNLYGGTTASWIFFIVYTIWIPTEFPHILFTRNNTS